MEGLAYELNRRRRATRARGRRRVQRDDAGQAALRRRRARPDQPHRLDLARRRTTPAFAPSPSTQLVAAYSEQPRGLIDGGADMLLVETIFDTLNAKAALFAIDELFEERGMRAADHDLRHHHRPLRAARSPARRRRRSGTRCATRGRSRSGLNCALGAEQLRPHVEELARVADVLRLARYPNAGLPNAFGRIRRDARAIPPRYIARVGRERLAQHRRRLLRHHARPHQGDRRSWSSDMQAARARRSSRACGCRAWSRSTSARTRSSSTSASAPTSPARRPSRA